MQKDAGILVELMNGIDAGVSRRVDFLHIPVPGDRIDRAYFEPLRQFTGSMKVYFGLIHHDNEEGTNGFVMQLMKTGMTGRAVRPPSMTVMVWENA